MLSPIELAVRSSANIGLDKDARKKRPRTCQSGR